jgi:pectinesterase
MNIFKLTPSDDIQESLKKIPENSKIILEKGVYTQKIKVTKNNIILCGEGENDTIITFDDYAKKIHSDGREYNTFRTYTLCITGDNVHLENLTVENSNTDPRLVGQCVALSVHGTNFSAKNITLKSTQDTLFLSPFPDDLVLRYKGFIPDDELYTEGGNLQKFENCKIYGTVDFIFGCGEANFVNCDIISIKDERGYGFVAAPSHSLKQSTGFVFEKCNILSEGADEGSVYLARPWRDFGKCEFYDCTLDSHINPALFDKWNDTNRDKSARFLYRGLKSPTPLTPVNWSKEVK